MAFAAGPSGPAGTSPNAPAAVGSGRRGDAAGAFDTATHTMMCSTGKNAVQTRGLPEGTQPSLPGKPGTPGMPTGPGQPGRPGQPPSGVGTGRGGDAAGAFDTATHTMMCSTGRNRVQTRGQ
jgi:hypothetical protein